jgi:hypothetical protein
MVQANDGEVRPNSGNLRGQGTLGAYVTTTKIFLLTSRSTLSLKILIGSRFLALGISNRSI